MGLYTHRHALQLEPLVVGHQSCYLPCNRPGAQHFEATSPKHRGDVTASNICTRWASRTQSCKKQIILMSYIYRYEASTRLVWNRDSERWDLDKTSNETQDTHFETGDLAPKVKVLPCRHRRVLHVLGGWHISERGGISLGSLTLVLTWLVASGGGGVGGIYARETTGAPTPLRPFQRQLRNQSHSECQTVKTILSPSVIPFRGQGEVGINPPRRHIQVVHR